MRHPIRAYSFIISHAVKSLEDVKFIVYSRLFKKFKSMSLELDEDDYDCQILSVQYSLICVAPMLKGQKTRSKNSGVGGSMGFLWCSWWFLYLLASMTCTTDLLWLAVTCSKWGPHRSLGVRTTHGVSVDQQRWHGSSANPANPVATDSDLFRYVQIVQIVQICSDRSAFAFCAQNCHGKQGLYGFVHSYVAIPRRSNK